MCDHKQSRCSVLSDRKHGIVSGAIAQVLGSRTELLKLNISHCRLRQAGTEVAQALPSSQRLKRLNLSLNELYYGQRRLALQLGQNAAW
jgi:hypothetical protein